MTRHTVRLAVQGPWSLETSRRFWEGFTPAALPRRERTKGAGQPGQERTNDPGLLRRERERDAAHPQPQRQPGPEPDKDGLLRTVFRVDRDWSAAAAEVAQRGETAVVTVIGDGDLDAAAAQVARFLSLDVDARQWPAVGRRDPVIGDAQRRLPGLRPCGFHSPYEAAAWAVLSQRLRVVQAAKLRADLIRAHGDGGAFPAPQRLRTLDLDLPGRKTEYLHAVADAALDGVLDGADLHTADPEDSIPRVRAVQGLGPFAAELVVLRGANAPDAIPHHERRLEAVIDERYGKALAEVSEAWRPLRTWAAVHLRALSELGA